MKTTTTTQKTDKWLGLCSYCTWHKGEVITVLRAIKAAASQPWSHLHESIFVRLQHEHLFYVQVFRLETGGSVACRAFQRWASKKARQRKPHDVYKCKYTIRLIIVSERWEKCNVGIPPLWLGTLWRQWIMYTCTHSPQQYTRITSNSLPHSYTVQPAKHRVYICQTLADGI